MSDAVRSRPWLMAVSDRGRLCTAAGQPAAAAGDLLVAQAAAAADAGVAAFQLREPDLDARTLLTLAERLARVAGSRMQVLVNDRADVAAAAGVGVHLRSASLPSGRLRCWLPTGTLITRSVHDRVELESAGQVDAVLAGTVLVSASKPAGSAVLGVAGLAALAAISPVPVVGIGGLGPADWPALREAGAAGLAAIGAFLPRAGESVADAVARVVAELAAFVD